jgi:formylglycine-generating enzyme required for sulfatase activity/arylsulfatase A-like enzyme
MNNSGIKPIVVPLSVAGLLLTAILFYSIERPKADSRKSIHVPEIDLNVDSAMPPDHDSATSSVRTTIPTSTETIVTNSIGMQLIRIPIGEFWMGSPVSESGRWEDEHRHRVGITKPFDMSIHEVTIGQFQQFVNATAYRTAAESDRTGGFGFDLSRRPIKGRYDRIFTWKSTGYAQTEHHPVANLTWDDANAFVEWLSREEAVRYRLPTEAEWEYACRAGSDTTFQEGLNLEEITTIGNVADMSLKTAGVELNADNGFTFVTTDDGYVFTAPVGSFRKNAFGLYDMTGNVCEWCSDWFHENYYLNSPAVDPQGPENGVFRVFRGGAWQAWSRHFRSANRARYEPDFRAGFIGMRVVRDEVTTIAVAADAPPQPSSATVNQQSFTNSMGMQFTRISPGKFLMGTAKVKQDHEEFEHTVQITRPFYLGTHEVTVGQFRRFANETGYRTTAESDQQGGNGYDDQRKSVFDQKFNWMNTGFRQSDQHPVTNLTRQDVDAFLQWLSVKESQDYRLPTEAEWEYACRANGPHETQSKGEANVADGAFFEGRVQLHTTDGNMAPFKDGYVYTAPVGSFVPNAFGLFDMTGNVAEWCADWFSEQSYQQSSTNDPVGPSTGTERVVRGGSWRSTLPQYRRTRRDHHEPTFRSTGVGLRVAMTAPDEVDPEGGSHGTEVTPKAAAVPEPAEAPFSVVNDPDSGTTPPEGKLADPVVVRLNEPWSHFSVGGSGRYFIFDQPNAGSLMIVDIASGSVVHELKPVLNDVLFSAGAEALFVARPAQGTLERIELGSFNRQKLSSLPVNSPPYALRIGTNAVSPLFLACESDASLIDGRTLERIGDSIGARGRYGYDFQLSADGQTAIGIVTGLSPVSWQRMIVGQLGTQSVGSTANHAKNWSGPTADGSLILIESQECDRNLRRIPMGLFAKDRLLPTVDPRYFLAVRFGIGNVQCQICNVADRRTIYTIHDFEDMGLTGSTQEQQSIRNRMERDRDSSFWFLPELKSFVTLNWDRQRILIYPFELEEALKKKGDPWLYVTSIPPLNAVRGSELSHQFQALSSFGNVEYSLESAVEGMSLSTQGELHWKVPIVFEQESVRVLVRATSSDNETFVQFEVSVQDPPEEKADPPEERVEPPKKQVNAPLDLKSLRAKRPFIAKGEKPDIVVILAENLNWPLPARNAGNVELPGIEFLMREGVTFSNAFVATTVPTAARATILTGQWPWRLEGAANFMGTLPETAPTFIEILRDTGYYTSFKGIRWAPGQRDPANRKPVGDYDLTKNNQWTPNRRQAQIFWLPEFMPDHLRANQSGSLTGENVDVPKHLPDATVVRGDMEAYHQEIGLFDRSVSSTISRLRKAESLDNTVIIVTSVFGAPLPRGRGNHYDFGTHVPLIVYWPGMAKPGTVIDEFVSLVDLTPTIFEIAGITPPKELSGISLVPLIKGNDTADRTFVIHGRERNMPGQEGADMGGYPTRAIRTGDFLYIHNFEPARWPAGTPDESKAAIPGSWLIDCIDTPTKKYMYENRDLDPQHRKLFDLSFGKRAAEELYDLKSDTEQMVNIASEPSFAEQLKSLREKLFQRLRDTNDPRVTNDGPDFDAFEYTGWKPNVPEKKSDLAQ